MTDLTPLNRRHEPESEIDMGLTPEQHRQYAAELIIEGGRYGHRPSVLRHLEMVGVEHTAEDAKAIFELINTATITTEFPEHAITSAPYTTRLLAEIDKLNDELGEAMSILAKVGDAISPTGERPEEALGTLAQDVEAVARDRFRRERDAERNARAATLPQEPSPHGFAFTLAERGLADLRERQSPDRHTADPGYKNAASLTGAQCNVAGCDHTRPETCEIVRCATCNEPYDGTEPPAAHIARAHLDILSRERFGGRHGGIVRSDVSADNPGDLGGGCMFSDVARVIDGARIEGGPA